MFTPADSISEGIEKNIVWGLTAFNTDRVDEAFIYPNFGHGIVDPLTGALLWLGVLTVLLRAIFRRGPPWSIFPLVGFLLLWLVFAFLVGQAPDYPRMLVILPFVAYLVTEGIRLLAGAAQAVATPRLTLARTSPMRRPSPAAAQPRWVSRIWPTFIRLGTPSGFNTMSIGVPSSR